MYKISLQQDKKRVLISPDMAFVFTILIGILVIVGAPVGNTSASLHSPSATLGMAAQSAFDGGAVSFAADEQYWDANCSYGWSTNSVCNDIVSRTKLCEKGLASAYCSEYKIYMQRIHERITNNYNL